jgi:hypothetical protein
MTLKELLDAIISSSKTDWNTIVCWGAQSGPSYHNQFEFFEVYNGQKNVLHSNSHGMVASYKPDVSVTIAWGLVASKDFNEPWATNFPDSHASSHHVDVFFNNALVYRDLYVSVDGGRAKLPLPRRRDDLVVPRGYYTFIKLLDGMEGYISDYERYFKRAGLRIIDAEWPE